nr:PrgH/EprH family type III secretion apparatus protein [Salmonella enterica]
MAIDKLTGSEYFYIVRLLNSSLNGCEFPLLTGRTLFVVGQSDALTASGQLPDIPADSFFIPLDHGGVNFEIQVDTDTTEIILHELKEGKVRNKINLFCIMRLNTY